MSFVNITTSDRGWILERLAREIETRLPYVRLGEAADPSAAIQYYMTYSCRQKRISPVELAYFAHLEPEGEARDRFFSIAGEVEHCICHARLYEEVLREHGVGHVSTVAPGVDLEHFRPKLRIGVVGRTYHTGRKGEHVVAQVMDIPEIEWSFTGQGWPGPALELPAEGMPDFYRSLDYVLVPALYEGGPMAVVEALACGTEVIAPPIGWVPEFPHVEFKVGDAADLRRVLLELVEKKRALRASVIDRTWDAWAEGHDRVFQALASTHGLQLGPPTAAAPPIRRARGAGLFLHGNENRSQGGPSVRVPRLGRELTGAGTPTELRIHPAAKGFSDLELVHAFNVWSPRSALDLLRRARASGRVTVFSPIFLDLGKRDLWQEALPQILAEAEPGEATDIALASFRESLEARRAGLTPAVEAERGFFGAVREMAALSDRLIFLSERERTRLVAIGARVDAGTVVRNPVDAELFANADPELFAAETGLRDFVLCVARIESRKNQAMLVHALRGTGLPIVLIGHTANQPYRNILERHRTPNLHIIDRLPPNSPLLASAFAAARVAVLPSWSEGAPLAALEAAASGANLVLSDESGESEYFGDRARYLDPGDPASIRRAVLEAWESRRDEATAAAQKAFIAESYNWDRHRAATEEVYAEALALAEGRRAVTARAQEAAPAEWRPVSIVYDMTTSANHSGRWTGIARVEAALALALHADARAEVRFIAWNNKAREFVEIPFEAIRAGKLSRVLAHYDTSPIPLLSLPEGAHLVVPGSAWMQNALYAENVVALARRHRLRLSPIIHDIIPTRFPFWFNEGYAPVFEQNLAMLLDGAEQVIAISQATRRDVEEYASRVEGLFIPEVQVFREGDEISQISGPTSSENARRIERQFAGRNFVLTVGAIHQRKNHKLLYDVWIRLAERMGSRCPQLVIVGGIAWNGHDVARALKGDPRLRGLVSVLEEVDDEALDWLYSNALFTVYPSLYEGWGLPVAESLRYGRICLAADTSSVPEIAPGLVELIDPLDTAAWVTKVQFYAGSRTARAAAEARIAENYRPFSWASSAEALLDVLSSAEGKRRPERPYTLGAIVNVADRVTASRVRWSGWHAFERWGCWAASTTSSLRFAPGLAGKEPLIFLAEARALSFPDTPFGVRVLANGVPVAQWQIRGGDIQVLHALIPASIAASGKPIEIELVSSSLTPVRQVTKSDDQRHVGIGIAQVALAPLSCVPDAGSYFGAPRPTTRRMELSRRYDLLRSGEGAALLVGKWTSTAAWGVFSAEMRPRLSLVVQEMPGQDLDFSLWLRPVATGAVPLMVLVMANGTEVGSFTFGSADLRMVSFTVPAACRARAHPLTIDLVAVDASTPKALGLGASEEAFGFGLFAVEARLRGAATRAARLPIGIDGTLQLGADRKSGSGAALAAALVGDWHAPEREGTWSFNPAAALPLVLAPDSRGGVLLRAEIKTHLAPPGGTRLQLLCNAGGRMLARHTLAPEEMTTIDVAVPPECIGKAGELDLTFALDSVRSPLSAGIGDDERPIGLLLQRVRALPLPLLDERQVLVFRKPQAGEPPRPQTGAYLRGSWFAQENAGQWSEAELGGLTFQPASGLRPGWRVFALCRAFGGTAAMPAVVEVEHEGAVLDRWVFTGTRSVIAEIRGLSAHATAPGPVTLFFRRRDAISPAQAGAGGDPRVLGIQLTAFVLLDGDVTDQQLRELFAAAGFGRNRMLQEVEQPEPPKPAEQPAPTAPAAAAETEAVMAALAAAQPPDLISETMVANGTDHPAVAGPVPALTTMIDLSSPTVAESLKLDGWFPSEAEGRWSKAQQADIYLPRPTEAIETLNLQIFGRVYGTHVAGPARVEVLMDRQPAGELVFRSDDFVKQVLELDCRGLKTSEPMLQISFRRREPISPADAGEGSDKRQLGVLVQTLTLVWQ